MQSAEIQTVRIKLPRGEGHKQTSVDSNLARVSPLALCSTIYPAENHPLRRINRVSDSLGRIPGQYIYNHEAGRTFERDCRPAHPTRNLYNTFLLAANADRRALQQASLRSPTD